MQNNLNVSLLVFVICLKTVNIYMCQEQAGIWQSYSSLYFFLISIVFDLICEIQLKHCNTFSTIMYIIASISIKSTKVYFFNTNVNKKSTSKTNMNLGIFYYKPLTLRHPSKCCCHFNLDHVVLFDPYSIALKIMSCVYSLFPGI